MRHETILVLDFGVQYNQLIGRRVRDLAVYSEVHPLKRWREKIEELKPRGIIFAGGPGSANAGGASPCPPEILSFGIPVLSVCLGSQIAAKDGENALYAVRLGSEAEPAPFDEALLQDFLCDACGCTGDWSSSALVEEFTEDIRRRVGDGKVLLGLSGGVDSSVSAALLQRAVGRQLTCIFVDTGLMRKNEGDEVEEAFSKLDLNFIRVDAEARFLAKLAGVTEPEKKRAIIGEEFIRVFEDEAKKVGTVDFLAQGTIYPDIIESGTSENALVKSHHNVGGLPSRIDFKEIIEPLRLLFKDEVRRLGMELGLPEPLVFRQPFPGPGLGIRVIGEVTKARLDILREADAIFREEVAAFDIEKRISQYFVVMTDVRSVGVKNDSRTYDYMLALRAVSTVDFMTAEVAEIPWPVLQSAGRRIVAEVKHVNRVVYDITSKPPATIEWE